MFEGSSESQDNVSSQKGIAVSTGHMSKVQSSLKTNQLFVHDNCRHDSESLTQLFWRCPFSEATRLPSLRRSLLARVFEASLTGCGVSLLNVAASCRNYTVDKPHTASVMRRPPGDVEHSLQTKASAMGI